MINKQRVAGDEQRHETTIDQTPVAVDVIASQILPLLKSSGNASLATQYLFSTQPFLYGVFDSCVKVSLQNVFILRVVTRAKPIYDGPREGSNTGSGLRK